MCVYACRFACMHAAPLCVCTRLMMSPLPRLTTGGRRNCRGQPAGPRRGAAGARRACGTAAAAAQRRRRLLARTRQHALKVGARRRRRRGHCGGPRAQAAGPRRAAAGAALGRPARPRRRHPACAAPLPCLRARATGRLHLVYTWDMILQALPCRGRMPVQGISSPLMRACQNVSPPTSLPWGLSGH